MEFGLCLKSMRKLCKEDAMSTIKITGKVNSAICYAKVVEEEALDKIKRMCDSPILGVVCLQ